MAKSGKSPLTKLQKGNQHQDKDAHASFQPHPDHAKPVTHGFPMPNSPSGAK